MIINIYLVDKEAAKKIEIRKKEQRRLWREYEWRQSANTWALLCWGEGGGHPSICKPISEISKCRHKWSRLQQAL